MPKKIKEDDFLTPAEATIVLGKDEKSSTQVMLRHIRQGKLEAKNVGGDKKPRYLIQGKNLIKYRDTMMRRYETK